jgi:hypothetical protein
MYFIYYLPQKRRVSTVLLWLKNIINLKQNKYGNKNPKLFYPLMILLTNNKKDSQLNKIKLKIYKARLIQGF